MAGAQQSQLVNENSTAADKFNSQVLMSIEYFKKRSLKKVENEERPKSKRRKMKLVSSNTRNDNPVKKVENEQSPEPKRQKMELVSPVIRIDNPVNKVENEQSLESKRHEIPSHHLSPIIRNDNPVKNVENEQSPESKRQEMELESPITRNDNLEWHCLNSDIHCQMCEKSHRTSIVSHYVNRHPNSEVLTSRLSPDAANSLRNSKDDFKCKRIKRPYGTVSLKQMCYFCNMIKCYNRGYWIEHMAIHTGYFRYKCAYCSLKCARKNTKHTCNGKLNRMEKIHQPQFAQQDVTAYICDICNYVRFHESEIKKHLSCEHEGKATNFFMEKLFLKLSAPLKKYEYEHDGKAIHYEVMCINEDSESYPSDLVTDQVQQNMDA